jgi:hypothetical protein
MRGKECFIIFNFVNWRVFLVLIHAEFISYLYVLLNCNCLLTLMTERFVGKHFLVFFVLKNVEVECRVHELRFL